MKNKKTIIGIIIFVILIIAIVVFKKFSDSNINVGFNKLTQVYVATGGGKEDFLADPDINKILKKKYKLDVIYDTWSKATK